MANKKELLFKQGDRFDKNDVLAKNPNYFKGKDPRNVTYSTGRLCDIAVASLDATMEDSSMISQSMSKAMTARITMKKEVILGVNANIEYLVKKGTKVKTGDDLVIFDTSFEDDSINSLLGSLDEEVGELTKNTLHSKYTGRVVDVNIYYNHDIAEYSPSVQKILNDYINENKAKVNTVNATLGKNTLRLVNIKNIEKVEDNSSHGKKKIKGKEVDGLLIEVYIEYEDSLSVGDKVTYGTALKTTICDVFDEGENPYSETGKEIEAIFPPSSIVNRMTIDFYFQLYLNKTLIGLKKKVAEIWNE